MDVPKETIDRILKYFEKRYGQIEAGIAHWEKLHNQGRVFEWKGQQFETIQIWDELKRVVDRSKQSL